MQAITKQTIYLPDDGKRKKAVVQQTHFHALMKRRL